MTWYISPRNKFRKTGYRPIGLFGWSLHYGPLGGNQEIIGTCLKGQCHEIFCFWFFSWISFPQASDYTKRAISNFFEYSQLKVCHRCQRHRWQMEKTFKQENFNNFVWTPLASRVNIYINFCLQVHFKVSASCYCCHYLPSVSTTPVANLPPVSLIPVAICHRYQQR